MTPTTVEKTTPQAAEIITPRASEPYDPTRPTHRLEKNHRRRGAVVFAAIACFIVLVEVLDMAQKGLWMRQLDFAGIF